MPLKDFLNNYEYNADEFDFDAFKSAVAEEYNKDEGVFSSKISKLEEDGTKSRNELRDMKATNFDLLRQIPTEGTDGNGNVDPGDEPTTTIDDLFGSPKKE